MEIKVFVMWLLVVVGPSSGQEGITVPEVEGFDGYPGDCNKGTSRSLKDATLDACAEACRNMWRCQGFVYIVDREVNAGDLCELKYEECDGTITADKPGLLTYINKDPMLDYPGNDTICTSNGAQCVRPECCPYMYEAEEICSGYPARRCCLHPPDCEWKKKEQDLTYWMEGSYALPRSVYGCPDTSAAPWVITKVELLMSSLAANSSLPVVSRVPGPLAGQVATLSSCLQSGDMLSRTIQSRQTRWPKGSYCVYKALSEDCPEGMSAGRVVVDGATLDVVRHTLLEAVHQAPNDSVTVHFCCRDDGPTISTVPLPTPNPFSLFKSGSECQNVLYMVAEEDYILLDFGPGSSIKTFGQVPSNMLGTPHSVRLHLCHYRSYETCHFEEDNGRSYHGYMNITKSGMCEDWRDAGGWWNAGPDTYPELVRSIEKNHCTGQRSLNRKAFCLAAVRLYEQYPACAIPFCPDFRQEETVSKRGVFLPSRQTAGPLSDALLPFDGDLSTCTDQPGYRPWWQMDLQRTETIIGLTTKDTAGARCTWSSMDIYVDSSPEAFYNQEGLVCLKDFWGYGTVLQLKCLHPVRGQYVTLRQGTRPGGRITDIDRCLNLCEVSVFTKESRCGSTFGHRDIDPQYQVVASSSEATSGVEKVTLFSEGSWCAAQTDTAPYLQVDLLTTRTVTGFWTQGSIDTNTQTMVTDFQLAFGLHQNEMIQYEENNQVKVFFTKTRPQRPHLHDLAISIHARYVKFIFTKWDIKPCFRFNIIGCQFSQVNLVSGNPWLSTGGEVLHDDRRETCLSVSDTRWAITLKSEVNVLDVILRLDSSYSFNVEVWVTSDMSALERDTDQWILCGRQEVTSAIMGMRCDVEPIGKRVMFIIDADVDLTVCEVEVHGGTAALIKSTTYKRWKRLELSCAANNAAQILAFKKTLENYQFGETHRNAYTNMSEKTIMAAGAWCSGQTKECSVRPDLIQGRPRHALLGCVPVVKPDAVCQTKVTQTGPILLTDHYLRMYGTSRECSWVINPPPGKYVKLAVTSFKVQGIEKTFMDGDHLVEVGTCRDILSVGYVISGNQQPEMMEVGGHQTYISPEGSMVVKLTTCFRYRYKKPDVTLETVVDFTDCFGCDILSECSGQSSCSQPCGILQSPGYPLDYAPNRKCSWRMTVANDAYIRFEFNDFDVYQEENDNCDGDVVELFDFDRSGETAQSLGRYCNTFRPPLALETGWNVLRLDFYTDADMARKGFTASYRAITHDFSENVAWSDNSQECKVGWILYKETCIRVFNQTGGVTWLQAESECKHQGANLANIENENDMLFLNFLLISKYQITDAYIGLTDREQEGIFRWADGHPLTYTNWRQHEPNGGAIEACTVVSLAGVRAQPSWQDISCAAAIYNNYVCSYSTSPTLSPDNSPSLIQPEDVIDCGGGQMFKCSTKECIHSVLKCDGTVDCFNGTDEQDCGPTCGPNSFACLSGSCVSLTFVCDGQKHCQDGSDEANCDYPPCSAAEFKCHSGECVLGEARCDLHVDCADESDEADCTSCSANHTYQCYDGTCVRSSRVCDSYYDCPGRLQEDESAAACKGSVPRTCLDWRQRGYTENRRYIIQIPGTEPASVTCDMTNVPGHVITTVHHNNEAPNISFHGFEPPASYKRKMIYFATWEIIFALRAVSDRCEQYMEVICHNAEAFAKSYFVGADDIHHWYHDDVNDNGCRCRLNKVCKERPEDTKCYCSSPTPNVVHVDRGFFTQTSVIPVKELTMEDTGSGHEWVKYTLGPLRCYQKFKESEVKLRCKSGQSYSTLDLCLYTEDESGVPKGCRDATHLENCGSFQCPTNYFKCPDSFCIAASHVCDGQPNCENGQDEVGCEYYMCPGMMKCRGEKNCIPVSQVCDGLRQCKRGDDEWFCDSPCPKDCTCIGLTYSCTHAELSNIPIAVPATARKLDLSDNKIDLKNIKDRVNLIRSLIELILSRNILTNIPPKSFVELTNLSQLDLSENQISILLANTFIGLRRLKLLNLKFNPLIYIEPNAFMGLTSLPELDISKMKLTNITHATFAGMVTLKILDMSQNKITKLEAGIFDDLKEIRHIRMFGNRLTDFVKNDFAALHNLETMHSDDFMFCCFVNIQDDRCLPPKDLLSSCEDLMENNILRAFLWILGCMAFAGNAFVFLYRSASKDKDRVPSMLIRNLSAADLLMGLYMLAIASVDLYYRGVYIENAQAWKESTMCQVLGLLSTVASEASVFTLGLITVDRLINILFPLSTWKMTPKNARFFIAGLWLLVIIIATIPLIPGDYFQGVFYSRSGVCVSLYITSEPTPGWEYSFAIFHGVNLCVFIFIFFAYGYMYQIIKKAGAMGAGEKKKREMAAAKKMTLIVVTDFCCWVPINIMGFLALSGTQIPGVIYAWTVVFILPVNSALNPVLYTISSITFPWQKTQTKASDMSTSLQTERTRVIVGLNEKEDLNNTLETWMRTREVSILGAVVQVTRQMAQLLRNLHDDGLYLGQLDAQSVFINKTNGGIAVSFSGYPQMISLNPEGMTADMNVFGKVISRLLRASVMARKEKL